MKKLVGFLVIGAVLAWGPAVGATTAGRNGKIAFSRGGADPGIYVMEHNGTGVHRLTAQADLSPAWSPDGSRIAFVRWQESDGSTRLFVMNGDGTGRRAIGHPSRGPEEGCAIQRPTWSSDSGFIAYLDYCFDQDPRVAQIRVVALADGAETEVTEYEAAFTGPQPWSPEGGDSQRLTFTGGPGEDTEVYVIHRDGTGRAPLTDDTNDQIDAAWSPDGATIVFSAAADQGDRTSLWSVTPAGGTPVPLVSGAPHATDPRWSPDGTKLLFSRRTVSFWPTATIADADGTDEVTVRAGFDAVDAAWAPNSRSIVFSHNGNLVRYRLQNGSRTTLTSGFSPDWQRQPTGLCDGREVTVELGDGEAPTSGPDVIRGTAGDDIINALAGDDIVCALGGDDIVSGNQGQDRVFGGGGDDEMRGNSGDDILRGRAGDDLLYGQVGDDTLDGGADTDTCRGGTGPDTATACETTVGVP